jgi:uncharacterized protein
MNDEPKFVTDASLAGLARWLRLLGFDTVVYSSEAGRPMMRLAEEEQRILLTRRRDMKERQFAGDLFLLPEASTGRQLSFVISKYSLKANSEKIFSICLICNHRLHPVGREDVRDLVPPFVFENCDQYNQCKRCGKIYWQGTHVRNALQFLENNNIRIIKNEEM